jgi:hypothetical protein
MNEFSFLDGVLLGYLLTLHKIVGDDTLAISDLPASRALSSLQWLVVHVFPTGSRTCFPCCVMCDVLYNCRHESYCLMAGNKNTGISKYRVNIEM